MIQTNMFSLLVLFTTDTVSYWTYVTGFEKTWLPHTQYQTSISPEMDCWFNTISYSTCSKATSLVSVALDPV